MRAGGYVIDFGVLAIGSLQGLEPDINGVGYHVRDMRIVNDNGKRVAGFGTVMFGELTNGRYVTIARSDLSRAAVRKGQRNDRDHFRQ